jgi:predicted phosphoribosyltransferase
MRVMAVMGGMALHQLQPEAMGVTEGTALMEGTEEMVVMVDLGVLAGDTVVTGAMAVRNEKKHFFHNSPSNFSCILVDLLS